MKKVLKVYEIMVVNDIENISDYKYNAKDYSNILEAIKTIEAIFSL